MPYKDSQKVLFLGGGIIQPICHFDIPAENFQIMKAFYGEIFGWTIERDEDTIDRCSIRFPITDSSGGMTGALVERSAPIQPIGCYFSVPSVEDASIKIKKLGGVVFVPRTAVPDKGYYACCLDPEKNYFVIWEFCEKAK